MELMIHGFTTTSNDRYKLCMQCRVLVRSFKRQSATKPESVRVKSEIIPNSVRKATCHMHMTRRTL